MSIGSQSPAYRWEIAALERKMQGHVEMSRERGLERAGVVSGAFRQIYKERTASVPDVTNRGALNSEFIALPPQMWQEPRDVFQLKFPQATQIVLGRSP
ncbi:hypothetical protein [Streptomyces werraensis]|uniref:hypothetical protein n=1 Tax=Streptomyces werraensis TaxID=68284 RepID=UPI00382B5423